MPATLTAPAIAPARARQTLVYYAAMSTGDLAREAAEYLLGTRLHEAPAHADAIEIEFDAAADLAHDVNDRRVSPCRVSPVQRRDLLILTTALALDDLDGDELDAADVITAARAAAASTRIGA